jgi:hypothetical protein
MPWLFRELRIRAFRPGKGKAKTESTDADEPRQHLPDAEISEAEREEAVRRYQRELEEDKR